MPRGQLLKIRRDTAANFAAVNPVLALGEPAVTTDTHVHKTGDGVTAWNSLAETGSTTYAPIASPALTGSPTVNGVAVATTETVGPVVGSDAWLKAWAPAVADDGAVGAITINGDGVATGFAVVWPDGTTGVFAATTVNSTWMTVDAWTLTYVGATTKTVTQAAVTRDGATGAVTNQPALSVA